MLTPVCAASFSRSVAFRTMTDTAVDLGSTVGAGGEGVVQDDDVDGPAWAPRSRTRIQTTAVRTVRMPMKMTAGSARLRGGAVIARLPSSPVCRGGSVPKR